MRVRANNASGGGGGGGQVLFDEQWQSATYSTNLSKTCKTGGHLYIEYYIIATSNVTITKNGTTQTPSYQNNWGNYRVGRWDFDVAKDDVISRSFSSTGTTTCVGIGIIVSGEIIPYES